MPTTSSDATNAERLSAYLIASTDVRYRMSPDWSEMHELVGRRFLSDTVTATDRWLIDYIHPDDQSHVREVIDEAIRTKSVFELEHRVRRADGSWGWTFSRAVPIFDDAGEIKEWFGAASDVTARKDLEAKLRENEERQAFLLNLSDVLRPFANPLQIQSAAGALLGERLALDRCGYGEIDPVGEIITFLCSYSAPGVSPLPDRVRLDDLRKRVINPIGRGETLVTANAAADVRFADSELAEALAASQIVAAVTVPLLKENRLVAVFFAHQSEMRTWTASEIVMIEAVAERTWAAVERARAEKAQRESEERLRQFGDNSPDVLWIVDAKGEGIEYLSPAYERVWGEPRGRVMNDFEHWRTHVHPDDRTIVAQGLPRLLRGERHSIDYRIVRPDGQIRWIYDTGFPIKNDAGQVTRLAGIAQDLTARREAEDRVRQSERRFRSLLEGIPQLVWRAVDHGLWNWASPQWTELTGQTEADSHGWGWLDMVHPDDRAAARGAWSDSVLTDKFNVEYRLRMIADGRYRWFSTRATPVRDDEGRLIEWFGTSTDIDDLRQLQKHQQTLLGELQHRVRNSLAVVRSIARRTAETSETVEQFSMHLDGRLAAFARTQAAVTRDPGGGVDLHSIVSDELLAHTAREGENAHIEGPAVKLQPKAGETLALAFHELASNAVKYGALSVSRGMVRVSWNVESGEAGAGKLVIIWDEDRPGAPMPPPARRGFGTDLLENTLNYELEAETTLDFRLTGLHCVIIVPLNAEIAQDVREN